MTPSVPPFQQLHWRTSGSYCSVFVSGGVCTWKRHSIEMATVRVSGTVNNDDQRAYIKIETLRGKTPTEIHSSLMEVCGVDTVDRSTISRWAQRFREGRLSMENDPKSGRPRTSTDDQSVERVLQILQEDCRMTCEEIAHSAGISRASAYRILTERLHKRRIFRPVGSACPQ